MMVGGAELESPRSLAGRLAALWEESDQPPDIFAFLTAHPDATPLDRLDVLLTDQRLRAKAGLRLSAEDYLAACPDVAADPTSRLDLVYGEMSLAGGGARGTDPDSYATRFPDLHESLSRQWQVDRQVREIQQSIVTTRALLGSLPTGDPGLTTSGGPARGPAELDDEDFEGPGGLGRFAIRRRLGAGGMGVVYRAYDRQRGELVALKTMRWAGPATLLRFKREFRALADLAHPNLVALHELVSVGDQWCFTMELVDGVDFLEHVRAVGRVAADAGRLRDALAQLAAGLGALHAAGKVHRDLKPSNVLVTRAGRVVVLDFGLVAELEASGVHQTTAGNVVGTVAYMAPEQGASRPVSPASDWYSVGVMLYKALTGRPPFDGPPLEVLRAKLDQDPRDVRALAPDSPEDLASLCMDLLRREPESRPSGAEVLRRLGDPAVGSPAAPAPPPREGVAPLVGRGPHLEALAESFARVRGGRTTIVCVHGRSGEGKSTLVRSFLDGLATRDEAVILSGRCYEQESVPYKALDSLVDGLGQYLRRLPDLEVRSYLPRDVQPLTRIFPVLRLVPAVASAPHLSPEDPDPQAVRRRAFAGLRELLARLGDQRPLVLAIDDLQWGDLDSARLLADLLRPPDPPVLLAIACYRSEDIETSPFLRGLEQWREQAGTALDWRELAVTALTRDEARDLARLLLGEEDPAAAARAEMIARESGGNAFFVHELARAIRAHVGAAVDPSAPQEIALDRVILARVEGLPAGARRLLEAVAVAGRPIPWREALAAAELGGEDQAAAVLRSQYLVRGVGPLEHEEVVTYHDRIRAAVLGHLTPAARQAHHRRLALALERSGRADPELLAEHFQGAQDRPRAGHYCALAADRAAEALAFDRAAKLYQRALDLQPADDGAGRGLRVRLADALANAGRGAEAARQYLAVARGMPAAEGLELRRRAALQFLISGHVDEGLAALRSVLGDLGIGMPQASRGALLSLLLHRARLRLRGLGFRHREPDDIPAADLGRIDACWAASVGLSIVDPIRGGDFQARGLLLALRAGEPRRIARSLAMEAIHVAHLGRSSHRRAAMLLGRAESLARQVDDPHALGMALLAGGMVAYQQDRWADALGACTRAEEVFRRCRAVAWELATAQSYCLYALLRMGELAEMSRRLPAFLDGAREREDLYALANAGIVNEPAMKLWVDDDVDGARRALRDLAGRCSQRGFYIQEMNALFSRIAIELYAGDYGEAARQYTELESALTGSLLTHIQLFRIMLNEVGARIALASATRSGDPRGHLRTARRQARHLDREGMPLADGCARLIRAGIARTCRDDAGASRLLEEAESIFAASDARLHVAVARRRRGEVLGGDRGQALIAEADSWMSGQCIRNPARLCAHFLPFKD
jgi:eukaryotic-like serine/threonine-protein kinase